MKIRLLISWIILTLVSCGETDNKSSIPILTPVRQKPPASNNDSLEISIESAVFFRPDSMQEENIRAVTDPSVYESMQHDCFYQERNCYQVIKKNRPQVNIINASNVRYLCFIKKDATIRIIDLNLQNDPCGLFLFRPEKDPRSVDMTNIDTELGFYFSQ